MLGEVPTLMKARRNHLPMERLLLAGVEVRRLRARAGEVLHLLDKTQLDGEELAEVLEPVGEEMMVVVTMLTLEEEMMMVIADSEVVEEVEAEGKDVELGETSASSATKKATWRENARIQIQDLKEEDVVEEVGAEPVSNAGKKATSQETVPILTQGLVEEKEEEAVVDVEVVAAVPATSATRKDTLLVNAPIRMMKVPSPTRDKELMQAQTGETRMTMVAATVGEVELPTMREATLGETTLVGETLGGAARMSP
jgi:hypothetical protein